MTCENIFKQQPQNRIGKMAALSQTQQEDKSPSSPTMSREDLLLEDVLVLEKNVMVEGNQDEQAVAALGRARATFGEQEKMLKSREMRMKLKQAAARCGRFPQSLEARLPQEMWAKVFSKMTWGDKLHWSQHQAPVLHDELKKQMTLYLFADVIANLQYNKIVIAPTTTFVILYIQQYLYSPRYSRF